ncbi:hypothetical protein KDL01_17655 [Actinospica durhamensis]|uniref:Uncharacterized protein n=1 Tax=Actinospica durhamensis TaxID=1508375 RepID=A0A941EPU1_9ACTN|nr:hypothetical protein [Actinospica durhamensis]MBR7835105.1 hypothetical protein [Actinospica durhamensis]
MARAPGRGCRIEGAMSHDKIKEAARRRMAATGESYAAARRHVLAQYRAAGAGGEEGGGNGTPPGQPPTRPETTPPAPTGAPQRFAISYDGMGRFSRWADTALGGGPDGGRVEIHADELRLRMADFAVDVPRASVRAVAASSLRTRGTIGVHSRRGSWLANGSAHGLVEITIDPPCRTERCLSSFFARMEVKALIVSLVEPDGFIAAARGWLTPR